MKENLIDIMNELKVGQIIITSNGKEWIFIEPKRKKALVRSRDNNKDYLISGQIEITQEIDQATVDKLEEEAINEFMHERAVRKMNNGQYFIGNDDKEYVFIRFKKTRFVFADPKNKALYTGRPNFIKSILEKISDEKFE
jgi:hypothetical protein